MKVLHKQTVVRYDDCRVQARELAKKALPRHLNSLTFSSVDRKALSAFSILEFSLDREVDWDWNFASQYCFRYPKAFDLSVWHGNSLCSLSLGRPTYNGTEMRLDFIERVTSSPVFSGEMFAVSLIAYEAYGKVIGADKLRIMNPKNRKLIEYYSSHGGFSYVKSMKGNKHYLVKPI